MKDCGGYFAPSTLDEAKTLGWTDPLGVFNFSFRELRPDPCTVDPEGLPFGTLCKATKHTDGSILAQYVGNDRGCSIYRQSPGS